MKLDKRKIFKISRISAILLLFLWSFYLYLNQRSLSLPILCGSLGLLSTLFKNKKVWFLYAIIATIIILLLARKIIIDSWH